MGITKGLAAIKHERDEQEQAAGIKWFKMPNGATWRIRILDDAIMVQEHQAGADFKKRALCTTETEGKCWACEYAKANPRKGWAKKDRVYLNVVVNDGKEDPFMAVWSIGTRRSPVWDDLEEAVGEYGTLQNREWRIKRKGEGTDTRYSMTDLGENGDYVGDLEPFDLETVVRTVPYAEQKNYFGSTNSSEDEEVDTAEW
jgi:hypothetical protein